MKPSHHPVFQLRPLALAVLLALPSANAQIVADSGAPRTQQPTVLSAPNGTPLVNIQTPSAAGVSRNTYGQFDVGGNGAILNNSRANAQTQLGGWVQGNPWLAGGEARVILNEVNASHPSQLRGPMEVAGGRAQVVIANPAGITCDGCGFLNANRVTLTTGTPILNGGNLDGYRVQRGIVEVTGAGMDSSRADYTDIIARAVRVNAGLWASSLQVTTGANEVAASDGATQRIAGAGSAPGYALDVSALGGMYAGKIALVGTEHGLGMRNAGHIGAQAGELAVTVDGRLENTGTMQSQTDTWIVADGGLRNAGTISAARTLQIRTPSAIDNQGGTLNARRLDAEAASLDNRGGTIAQTGLQALTLQAGTLSNRDGGRIGAVAAEDDGAEGVSDDQSPGSTGDGSPDGAQAGAGARPDVPADDAGAAPPDAPPSLADGVVRIAGHLNNEAGHIRAGGAIDLQAAAGLDNDGGHVALRNLTTIGGDLLNRGGALAIGAAAILQADHLANDNGQFSVGGTLVVSAGSLSNRGGKLLQGAAEDGSLRVADQLDNTGGVIGSNASQFMVDAGTLDNHAGQIIAGAALSATVGRTLDNAGGEIIANGDASVQAGTLSNRAQGVIASASGNLSLAAQGTVDNEDGTLQAQGQLAVAGAGLSNARGAIVGAHASIDTQGHALDNTDGALAATDGTLRIRAGALNNAGRMQSAGALTVEASDIDNQGEIAAAGTAELATTGALRNRGKVQASELDLRAQSIDNTATGEITGERTRLTASATLTNRGLIDGASTRIGAHTLDNAGSGRLYGDHLAIQADTLHNREEAPDGQVSAATIAARERLDIGARQLVNREQALIFSAGAEDDALNIGGSLDVDGHATGRAEHVRNASATIESLGGLTLSAGLLQNTNTHFATERVQVKGPTRNQTIQPRGNPDQYDASEFTWENWSKAGRYRAKDGSEVTAWTQYDITSTEHEDRVTQSAPAIIRSGGAMWLDGDELVNDKSQILAGGALTGTLDRLQTLDAEGKHVLQREGTSRYSYSKWRGRLRGHRRYWDPQVAYTPADVVTSINLGVAATREHVGRTDSGRTIDDRRTDGPRPITEIPLVTGDGRGVIRTVAPGTDIPANTLFRPAPDSRGYLIETDPRFADYRQWLSSDYLLGQLGIDPASIQKRLGDGFHEQRMVREQLGLLTGRRFLDGYASDEAQYQALLANGVTVAREWNLRPGVALSGEQMAQLTTDIIWLVERPVTLPDGTTATALVPQVYVRTQPGDIKGDGTLIAADVVDLQLEEGRNTGTIAGRTAVRIDANNLRNLGGRITGDAVALRARTDIDNTGGTIDAKSALDVLAKRDLALASTTQSDAKAAGRSQFSRTNLDRVAGLYVTGEGGTLTAMAGRDVVLDGAEIANTGRNGQTVIAAGRDVSMGTVTVGEQADSVRNAGNYLKQGSTQEVGTSIRTTGDVTLSAGRDLLGRAATVTSVEGAVVGIAGRDAKLIAGERTSNFAEGRQHKHGGLLGSSSTTTRDSLDETRAQASTFSGNTVQIHAGRDIGIVGSNVVSDAGTTLAAKRDVTIAAAQETARENHFKETKKTGFLYSGGAAFTIGTQQQSNDTRSTRTFAAASTIGSTQGNVNIRAGNAYSQEGSHLMAPIGDIDVRARTAHIGESRETSHSTEESKFRQSGLTVAVTAPVISAIQTAQQMTRAASGTSDTRMQVLAGATTALAAKNTADAVAADPQTGGGIGISVTVGGSQSQSRTTTSSDTAAGSSVSAGGDIRLIATGAGADSDLTIRGADINAGGDVLLKADDKITLQAARNVEDLDRKSSSAGGGVGLAIQVGQGGASFGVTANASGSRGKANGTDVTWTNSHVTAGRALTIASGGDTVLEGAVARGHRIDGDIGGDLRIASLQDTHDYRSKDQSASGSVTVGFGFSGSANASQQKIDSNYASVTEQSGLKAGDGGFDVRVERHTALDGGVIASTRGAVDAGLNRLDTGTITGTDIENRAGYRASSVSIGGGFASKGGGKAKGDGNQAASPQNGVGTNQQGQAATGGSKVPGSDLPSSGGFSAAMPVAMGAKGRSNSTTRSGISEAEVTIRDAAGQQALTGKSADDALAALNRGVSTEVDGTNALKPIFDENKIKAGFEIAAGLQREMGTFLNNRAKEATAAQQELDRELKKPEAERDSTRMAELSQVLKDNATWGVGGTGRMIVTALAAAAGGNVTGSTAGMLQGAAVNYLQALGTQQVKEIADNLDSDAARVALHGIVACAGAAAQSQSCGAGAAGAGASVVLNNLLDGLNRTEAGSLTAEEKEARSNLVSGLVAGITSAVGGDAAAAGLAARIETENNAAFVPVVVGAVWLADKGLTTYEAWQDVKAVRDGTKTVEQLAQEKGEEYVVAVVAGNLARYGVKVAKHGGRWVAGKPDDLVKAETEALDRIGKAPNGPDLAGKAPNSVLNEQLVRDLDAGKLPGRPIGRPGTPREMPGSSNPSATAEDFAVRVLGRKPTQVELEAGKRMNGGNCNGCWSVTPDGGKTFISYRPAGKASEETLSTTATVEINSKGTRNSLNFGKELKLKFPAN
ncbi:MULTISPECIES: hemagglutinin repeat-containing protein [unclassified Cupriavidus]|uniref:hemagglutinin repeat-containing protein n=1 Tax=unclassified Cupriavidus TaxID=2640874 RepID=UPI001BFFEC57|nr:MULTISPECIES: hemagglutinin repeat-containing protein [unclassified Cupriavidus]MCA3182177.1 hemagglutinin repeat-containing protein [Cupriavidus sp.]MCA3189871.1 hemagglutinin repeat-containing protein [Cupriavidus sp.]MCA3196770.1 hemagglutinin repeat-containing protein [Cupriavidus sp.]MCA3204269.1 hemagglutinin repeat-containing protein [Cupriavidus sp.]QWE94011.1 hemagglutinin repeat-containing protein [Cupriavidus sp. EM10]